MSLKACPNPRCPFCLHHGMPAQYLATATACVACAGGLVAIAGPRRDAPTLVTGMRGARVADHHVAFLAGLACVLLPFLLAQLFGRVAYTLPLLALGYALVRVAGRSDPAWLAMSRPVRRGAS